MSWRPRSHVVALTALALVTLAALAPLVAADHAYSHRYIVYGRVVDAENNPVPGLTVDLGYEKPFTPEGPCANQPGTETVAFGPTRTSPVTNQFGEFIFCFHTHGMSRGTPGTGIIKIEAAGVEQKVPFDGFMRYSFVDVKLPAANTNANKTILNEAYTIFGRAWSATDSEIKVEGVGVYGDTVHDVAYEVTVTFEGKDPQTFNGTTNHYGDFSFRVPVNSRPTGGSITLAIQNETFTAPVDAVFGVTHIRGQIGDLHESNVPAAPLVALVGVVAVAALLVRRRE